MACVRPIFEYGIEVWNFAIQDKDKEKFRSIKNCLKRALGAIKTNSFEVLEMEAAVPPVNLRLELLVANQDNETQIWLYLYISLSEHGYFHGKFGAIERLNLLRALTPLLCQSS